MDDAPGQLLRETERGATYLVQSPLDFEGEMRTAIPPISYHD